MYRGVGPAIDLIFVHVWDEEERVLPGSGGTPV